MNRNQKIQTALASFGMSGQVFHGPSLLAHEDFEIKTILERSANLSRKMFPGVHIARDYREILKDPDIELIIINTPDAFHYSMAMDALWAGKHVVVEKPFTRKADDARRLIDLAEKKGLVVTVYHNRRWDGDFLTVQKVIQSGILGRIVEFESHFDRYRNFIAPNTWKEEGDEYSGVLYNLGSHMVDQALVLFGLPGSVTANLRVVRDGGKVSDYYDIRLGYKSFSALLKCSYLVKEPGPRYTLHGTKGSFLKWGIDPQEELLKRGNKPNSGDWGADQEKFRGIINAEINGLQMRGNVETERGNYMAFYDNLGHVLRSGGSLAVKPEEAMNVIRILELCLESHRTQSTVHL